MHRRNPSGRRIKKTLVVSPSNPVDGYTTTYLYDGDHIIAEYACGELVESNGNSNLVRKLVVSPFG